MQQVRPDDRQHGVDLATVRAMAEPIATAHGVRVVDVEYCPGPAGRILRVTIERTTPSPAPEQAPTGATIDDCVRVSRDLSTVLDLEEPIAHSYQLEVSSPGLERPLRTADDFRRQLGKLAKVKLVRPAADGQRVLRGALLAVGSEQLRMEVDGKTHEVLLQNVEEARLVFDFGRTAEKRHASRKKSTKARRSRRAGRGKRRER